MLPVTRQTVGIQAWGAVAMVVVSLATPASLASDPPAGKGRVDYPTQIKPLLRERCYACHGALKQKADLRLDTVAAILESGVVKRGDAAGSLLLDRVATTEIEDRMPPEHEGEPLSDAQVQLLRAWVTQGAPGPADEQPEPDPEDHWAFRPIHRPAVPTPDRAGWVLNPVDAFLAREHAARGLTPQPEAPREILLRRLYLDLIGLPPTPEEIAACLNDPSPHWYERTVSRLLEDPRYGQRWARHWMDIWRYSDWWGLGDQHRNSQKHIWHWRDWIVESLNGDTPYDEMVRLMLAADESHPNDLEKLRATGYLARNYFLFNRTQWMEETVEHVGKGLLGLTLNCAKCHDHKYDPIQQADFYRMRAFFEPYHVRTEMLPGEPDLGRDGLPRVFDALHDAPTYLFVRGEESNPDKSIALQPGVPALLAFEALRIEPVSLPTEAWRPERRAWVLEAYLEAARKNLRSAEAKFVHVKEKSATAGAGAEAAPVPPELTRAEWAVAVAQAELESVQRRADAMRASWGTEAGGVDPDANAAAVQAERQVSRVKARRAVAETEIRLSQAAPDKKEALDKELTQAREALLKAEEAAAAPVKPEDSFTRFTGAAWTATRFLDSTKDDPPVPFPPQSTGRRTALARWITDRRNPLTARVAVNHIWTRHMGSPLVSTVFDFGRKGAEPTHPELLDWLACELMERGWSMKHVHRLITTSAAYRMSSSVAGAEANVAIDPDNRAWWRRVPIRLESQAVRDSILSLAGKLDPTPGGPPVPPEKQEASTRRSLYFFHSNNERNLFLTTFDEASVKDCYRREQSVVPQQALALINSQLVLDASDPIAKRLAGATPGDDEGFIRQAFASLLAIRPTDAEIAACRQALDAWRRQPGVSVDQARANLVWALMNHNDFVTLR